MPSSVAASIASSIIAQRAGWDATRFGTMAGGPNPPPHATTITGRPQPSELPAPDRDTVYCYSPNSPGLFPFTLQDAVGAINRLCNGQNTLAPLNFYGYTFVYTSPTGLDITYHVQWADFEINDGSGCAQLQGDIAAPIHLVGDSCTTPIVSRLAGCKLSIPSCLIPTHGYLSGLIS